MHPFNLLTESWIPVRRADGSRCRIPPWRITEGGDSSHPQALVDIDTTRPDFKGALLELLIGLMQTALAPVNEADWNKWFAPANWPAPETLKAALAPLERYYNLFGSKPRFLQDLTLTDKEAKDPSPIAALLMDTPGENAAKHNGDFFIKRDQPPQSLCPACAAAALMTMQAYAPSGGVGYRVSLRGGGPLTVLVVRDTLWETIWANILPQSAYDDVAALPDDPVAIPDAVFPWAAPTHVSREKGTEIHRDGMHFLHHYWGMPRRIVLEPIEDDAATACPVCHGESRIHVRQFRTTNYGNNYGNGWRHPLTPYRAQGPGKEPLTLKGDSNGRAYNQWLGLVYGETDVKTPVTPARAVQHYRGEGPDTVEAPARIRAYGFDMDNMKARNWCEGEYPVYSLSDGDAEAFLSEVTPLVRAAELACNNLRNAVKEALFSDGARDAKSDATLLSTVQTRFWAETQHAFYCRVKGIIDHLGNEDRYYEAVTGWRDTLLAAANAIFASVAEDGGAPPRKAQQIYAALNRMRAFTYVGCSKLLGIPIPKEAKK